MHFNRVIIDDDIYDIFENCGIIKRIKSEKEIFYRMNEVKVLRERKTAISRVKKSMTRQNVQNLSKKSFENLKKLRNYFSLRSFASKANSGN